MVFSLAHVSSVLDSPYHSSMHLSRLGGRKNCDRIRAKGFLWKGKHFVVRYLPGSPRGEEYVGPPRLCIGLLASSKLDPSAVKRNRMRRRCREAFRTVLLPLSPISRSFQLLVSPRSSSLTCDFGALQEDARRFLSSLDRSWLKPHRESSSISS